MMGVLLKTKPPLRRMRFVALGCALAMGLSEADAVAAGARVRDATEEQVVAAKDKYQAGMQAFDGQKYEQALALFRESYDIVASPNSHLMIARALARLDRIAEAYYEYEQTMLEAQRTPDRAKYQPTAKAARNERAELEGRLAFVTPRVSASVSVNGREVPPDQLGKPLPVQPGPVEIVLRTPGGGETRQQVTAEAGKKTEVALEPIAPSAGGTAATPAAACPEATSTVSTEPSGIDQTTLALVFGGVGLAGVGTFVAFGLLNNSKYDELKDQCTNEICPENLADEGEKGRRYQTIANVGLGVGAVGLATGVILLLTAPSSSTTKEMSREKSSLPDVAIGPRSVTFRGRF